MLGQGKLSLRAIWFDGWLDSIAELGLGNSLFLIFEHRSILSAVTDGLHAISERDNGRIGYAEGGHRVLLMAATAALQEERHSVRMGQQIAHTG